MSVYKPYGVFSIIPGRLGQDAEVKTTKDNKQYIRLNVAVTAGRVQVDGQWQDKTQWMSLSIFDNGGSSAEFIKAAVDGKLIKGTGIELVCYLATDTNEKDGKLYINYSINELLRGTITYNSKNATADKPAELPSNIFADVPATNTAPDDWD